VTRFSRRLLGVNVVSSIATSSTCMRF
jgi:hypothetical protein